MSLLNPIALWGMLALLVPIILHLIHRADTKEQDWAAMEFLMEKEAHSVKRHSIREWLLLLSRLLLLLFLVFALAQPIGRLFSIGGSTPDTIFLLLDRSSGMGEVTADGESKMESTLESVVDSLSEFQNQTRLYLIDSASLEMTPLLEVENLPLLSHSTVVDTPCSVPMLLERAMREIRNDSSYGNAECWVISEGMEGSWRRDDVMWSQFSKRESSSAIKIRHFPVSSASKKDLRISVESVDYREEQVSLLLNITGDEDADEVAVSVKVKNKEEFVEVIKLNEEQTAYPLFFPSTEKVVEGEVSLPSDENPQNNKAYFTVGEPLDFNTLLISDEKNSELTENLRKAVSLSSMPHQKVKWASVEDVLLMDFSSYDFIIWASSNDRIEVKDKISEYISQGARALIFPNPKREGHSEGWFFSKVKESAAQQFFTVEKWNEKNGPWRNARSGESLPVDRIQAVSYAEIQFPDSYPLARWNDEAPMVTRSYLGEGEIYLMSTVPHYSWSNLENLGLHLIFLQRLLSDHLEKSGGGYMKTLEIGSKPFLAGIREEEGIPVSYNREIVSGLKPLSSREISDLLKEKGLSAAGSSKSPFDSWITLCLYLALIALLMECFMIKGRKKRKEVSHG